MTSQVPVEQSAGSSLPKTVLPAHIPALDGVRGLAILLVLLGHTYDTMGHLKATWFGRVLTFGGNWGWLGVDLFFVLSGFLITGILISTVSGPGYLRNFYLRRALRIFPLFYGVLLLLAVLTPALHLVWQRGHLAYLFYCQNIAMNLNTRLSAVEPAVSLQHFWSLAVEEQYYFVWPFVVWLLRDERKIMRVCLILAGISILFRIVVASLLPPNISVMTIYWELPTHCDGLLLGSWLALATRKWPTIDLIRHTRVLVWLALIVFLGAGCYFGSLDFHNPGMEVIGLSVVPIMLAGVVLRCCAPGGAISVFCSGRPLRFLGRYSYGIYVYQMLFVKPLQMGLLWLQIHLHSRTFAGIVYLMLWYSATVCVAGLSYKFLESPFLRLKGRLAPHVEGSMSPQNT